MTPLWQVPVLSSALHFFNSSLLVSSNSGLELLDLEGNRLQTLELGSPPSCSCSCPPARRAQMAEALVAAQGQIYLVTDGASAHVPRHWEKNIGVEL